jgi:DNA-binding PucR family transcriptional regulator
MAAVAIEAPAAEVLAREQFSNLYSLFVLSMMMFDGRDEQAILRLACTAVPQLGSCRVEAGYLARRGGLEWVPGGAEEPRPRLHAAVAALRGAEGAVDLADWAWAYPLCSLGGQRGYLVVGAPTEPSHAEQVLLRVLAQQTGAALSNAALHRTEREQAGRLRVLDVELAALNDRLSRSLAALQRQRRIYEVLSRVSAAGEGAEGIARAVHQLTGLPVVVEDRFGNLRSWAGPGCPDPYTKPSGWRRAQLLARALRDCRPVRDRERLIALARPRHEVLGVLALIDPDRAAGEHELSALEHGAVVLAAELAHQHRLTEVELRLRRDLVDDLLSGATDASVFTRAEALGHDLHHPHRAVVVKWDGRTADSDLVRAVARAVAELRLDCLMASRAGSIVLLAHQPSARNQRQRWDEMYRSVARELRCTAGVIGVGGRAESVAEVRRSYEEALRALSIRQGSVTGNGATVFDELGVYRLLAAGENAREVRIFVREWLGLLLDYDEGHRCELVRTLSTYLECGGNYDETAEALTIHRSTLRYRLQRIREVSGLDLGEVDSRFNLQVATRAWRVLAGAHPGCGPNR